MGLDMYLKKEMYISTYDFENKPYTNPKKANIKIKIEYEDGHKKTTTLDQKLATDGGIVLQMPFCYWRKANAIHKWFVDLSGREDDCQPINVSGKQLLELVGLCNEVLKDHSRAEELLPTQDGFFFGGTDYDEYYFNDLKHTVEKLKDIDPDDELIYRASW